MRRAVSARAVALVGALRGLARGRSVQPQRGYGGPGLPVEVVRVAKSLAARLGACELPEHNTPIWAPAAPAHRAR